MAPSLSIASMVPVLSWGFVAADPLSLPQCCGTSNLDGCTDPQSNATLQHWCRADSMKLPQSKPLTVKWDKPPSSPYDCLSKCEINPQCYYVTYDSGCKWYGRGTETHTLNNVWFLMQTEQDNTVPQDFTTDGPYKKVDLGNQNSYAQCKAAWVEAFMNKTVDLNTGEYAGTNVFFTFADTKTGKGNVRVRATYNAAPAPPPTLRKLLDASPAPAPPVECDGKMLVWNGDDSVGLSSALTNSVWFLSGSGMFPAGNSGKCLTTDNQDSGKKKDDTKAKIVDMATDQSTCVSIGNLYKDDNKGDYPGKQWIVHINAWGDAARYGMGKCDDPSSLKMHHLKKSQDACTDGDCGSFTFSLVDDSTPDFQFQAGSAAEGNCFGFVTTTTTSTSTPAYPGWGGWCVGKGGAQYPEGSPANQCQPCHDMEDQCGHFDLSDGKRYCQGYTDISQVPGCHNLAEEAPSSATFSGFCVGRGGSQYPEGSPANQCQTCSSESQCGHFDLSDGKRYCQGYADVSQVPGCYNTAEDVPLVLNADDNAETNFEMCPAIFPGVDVPCVGNLKCCGENTTTPECYSEEWNTCCKPPGSDISILCARGESCSSVNGVPICKPPGKACTCGKRMGLQGYKTHYFCEPKDSEKCFHAPDDAACFHLFGDDADFCYIPPAYPQTLI